MTTSSIRAQALAVAWGVLTAVMGCSDASSETENEQLIDEDKACGVSFSIHFENSVAIDTVGIVEWQTDMTAIDTARIEFGRNGRLDLVAPVDLNARDYRTLLLGMKPLSTYQFRIVATNGEQTCRSELHSIDTKGWPTELTMVKATIHDTSNLSLHGGYTVSSAILAPYAFIIDGDGDYVWWYRAPIKTISRARMSWDGKHMLIGNINLKNGGIGAIIKVSMDGLEEETIELPARHHDFTVLPQGGTIGYIAFDTNGLGVCDTLMERSSDGATRVVYTIRDDFGHRAGMGEWCHANAVNYVPREDAYYLSVLHLNAILKIDRRTGTLVWVLGGEDSSFEGVSWVNQHQHQLLNNGNLLIFSNGAGGFEESGRSLVLELALDKNWAIETWRYESGFGSSTLGDVQRLANGNTVVTYSNAGLIHEVDTDTGQLLLSFQFDKEIVGYTIRRDSLFGPPQAYL